LIIATALYVLALLIGALDVGRKSGWQYAPLAPVVFAVLHFAYGFGSLWGIVRFSILRASGLKNSKQMQMSR